MLARQARELAARRDLRSGRLVLGSSDTLAIYALPALFTAYRERYPGVDVELVNRPSPALAELVARERLRIAPAGPLENDLLGLFREVIRSVHLLELPKLFLLVFQVVLGLLDHELGALL